MEGEDVMHTPPPKKCAPGYTIALALIITVTIIAGTTYVIHLHDPRFPQMVFNSSKSP